MLQIRLNKGSTSDGGTGSKSLLVETVTVACPDHLVLADLPVAKGLGLATAASRLKVVGRRSRRQLGERVHFCVRCDFPIAIYGRLSPCEHAFCLDCARSDSICYLCDERIQKIQTIKMMEGIFICAAPHCLKSFLKKTEFESHIHESHSDLLHPNTRKEETNESESSGPKQSGALDSSARAPPVPAFSPSSNSQPNDRDDRARHQHSWDTPSPRQPMQPNLPPYYVQNPNHPPDPQADSRSRGHQNFEIQAQAQSFGQIPDRQKQAPYLQPPLVVPVPMNPNQLPPPPPPFGFPPLPSDGNPPFYPFPYEVTRPEATVVGPDPSSLLPYPQLPSGPVNNPESFPRHWVGPSMTGIPYEAMQNTVQGMADGSPNPSDPQARAPLYMGGYGRNLSGLAPGSLPPPMDPKGSVSSQHVLSPPPPPQGPPPGFVMQQNLSGYPSSDSSLDSKNYG